MKYKPIHGDIKTIACSGHHCILRYNSIQLIWRGEEEIEVKVE